jgi:hypothetical protein
MAALSQTALDSEVTIMTRRYTRLTEAQWAEVEALWEIGDVTLSELSEQFGVSSRALQAHFKKAGIMKGRKAAAMAAAVRHRVLQEELTDEERLLTRAKEVRERAYVNASAVEDLVMGQLALVQQDPSQAPRVSTALKALHLASNALERLHNLKYRALGLDRHATSGETLPELPIIDLTEERLAEIRASHGESDGDGWPGEDDDQAPVDEEIVIEGGEEDRPADRSEPAVDSEGFRLVRDAPL